MYLLGVNDDPSTPSALARKTLLAAAPQAATRLVEIMEHGDKDDAISRQAANDILAINGIAPPKAAAGESQARVAGAAVLAAILGMAKVAGLRNVSPKTFANILRDDSVPSSDLPPELLEEQDTLR